MKLMSVSFFGASGLGAGVALAMIAALLHFSHRVVWAANADAGPLEHSRTEFEFEIPAAVHRIAPLFGPEGERTWGGEHWNPQFLYPRPPKDVAGAVFTVRHGEMQSTWVNTAFDLPSGHVQYVYFVANAMVTVIDIHLIAASDDMTNVKVVYERTALTAHANAHVISAAEKDRNLGKEWETAFREYLSKK